VPRFFRIVASNPPTASDFLSYQAMGMQSLRQDAESLRLASGISVYATEAQAMSRARSMPWLGSFIAELDIPEEGAIAWERTDRRTRGHRTLWGTPDDLLASVVSVVLVA